jgi:hypothetical protein
VRAYAIATNLPRSPIRRSHQSDVQQVRGSCTSQVLRVWPREQDIMLEYAK